MKLSAAIKYSILMSAILINPGCIVWRDTPSERPHPVQGKPAVEVVIPKTSATAFWVGVTPNGLSKEIREAFFQSGYEASVTTKSKKEFTAEFPTSHASALYLKIEDKTPVGYSIWGVFGALSLTLLPSYAETEFILTARIKGVTTEKKGKVSDFVWLPLMPGAIAGTEGAAVAACIREVTSALIADLQAKDLLPKADAAKGN
jgi:hypothetical protein